MHKGLGETKGLHKRFVNFYEFQEESSLADLDHFISLDGKFSSILRSYFVLLSYSSQVIILFIFQFTKFIVQIQIFRDKTIVPIFQKHNIVPCKYLDNAHFEK